MQNTIKSLFVCLLLLIVAQVKAATTLRFAHFWPAASQVHEEVFVAWKESVEAASDGELQIELYPAQTLSKAAATYEATVNGITNIGATAQGYINGRFPLSQVVELPGIASSAVQGACVLQQLYDEGYLAAEYADSHVLFMFATGPGLLHTKDKPVHSPEDLKGLRIRRPTAVAGELLQSMGAMPLAMPAPEIYTAMQRGMIDGLSFPWEAMKTFRINELASYHTQLPFYTLVFVATMNKGDYERLSPAMQAVIDNHSGMKWARQVGEVFDKMDSEGLAQAQALGHEILIIDDPLNHADWQEALENGIDSYLKQAGDKAETVYQAALIAAQSCQ